MLPALDICLKAFLGRDPAFDGVFFVAVRTTGIYCRPVCRVRQPLVCHVGFYPSAASCEAAGYRPCLRCRPETAPFSPAWNGTCATVSRALRLIEAGALDTGTVAALAERLGIGARHLGRLVHARLGAPPAAIARTVRVQRAKRLLDETDLTMDAIAERAGFRSARRMAAAFTALYGRPPSVLRERSRKQAPLHQSALRLTHPKAGSPFPEKRTKKLLSI